MQPALSASQPRNIARFCQMTGESCTSAASAASRSAAVGQSPKTAGCMASSNRLLHGASFGQGASGTSSRSNSGTSTAWLNAASNSAGRSSFSTTSHCSCSKPGREAGNPRAAGFRPPAPSPDTCVRRDRRRRRASPAEQIRAPHGHCSRPQESPFRPERSGCSGCFTRNVAAVVRAASRWSVTRSNMHLVARRHARSRPGSCAKS